MKKKYYLGKPFENVYFTEREYECYGYIRTGLKYSDISRRLDLTPKTVEFYVSNMRDKVFCRTRKILVKLIDEAGFQNS